MRLNKKVMLAAPVLALAVVGGGLLGGRWTDALTPWPDRVLAMATMRIDYTVPVNTAVSVTQESAIRTAKLHTGAPASAVVHSARLGFLNDPGVHNLLVWVVDVDGIRHEQLAGPFRRDRAGGTPQVTTRAVVLVSTTQPALVVRLITSNVD